MGILQYGRFVLDRGLTVCNLIDKAAALYGERPLFSFAPALPYAGLRQGMPCREVRDFMNRTSNVLALDAGLARFERVAIWKDNAADYFLFGLAAIRAGGIAVPINGGMRPAELVRYLADTGTALLVTDRAHYAALRDVLPALATLRCVLLCDGVDGLPSFGKPLLDLARALDCASPTFDAVQPAADEDVLLVHTSGTTGFPKAVIHTSGSLVAGVKGQMRYRHYFSDRDVFVNAAPANHFVYFLGMLSAIAGNSRFWLAGDNAADHVLRLIERERVSVVFCFPHTFLSMQELGLDRFRLDSVRYWLSAADSSHEAHIREFTRHGALLRLFGRRVLGSVYVDSLGSSEVGFGAVVRMASAFSRRFARYVGRSSAAGPRVRVADAHGRTLPRGRVGRLMVKGPTLFKGYWNAHDKLHGVVKNGWWWTGDIAIATGRRGFYHLDRATDVIRTHAGEAYSLAIEERLLKYPGVLEAVVVARPGLDGAHEPVAFVQPAGDAALDANEMLAWANRLLAPHERLAMLDVVDRDAIPRGLTGKVLKTALRRDLLQRAAPAL